MCGRFAVSTDPARLARHLHAVDETGTPDYAPNYNVAPTARVATVLSESAARRLRLMVWGFEPPWANRGRSKPLINARAETLTTSPAFRSAAAHRRCLVPMDGYYEWQPSADPLAGKRKTPYFFFRPDGEPLLVAGLWSAAGFTLVTTGAVGDFARVHDRMPLLVGEGDWDRWLDPEQPAPAEVLAAGPQVGGLAMREVSTLVNRVANNGPELIEAVTAGQRALGSEQGVLFDPASERTSHDRG
ncbi:MAG: SOS response-associated peptidase [Mycobacterium sp.]